MDAQQTKSPLLVTDLQINLRICQHAFKFLPDTVSDKTPFFPFSCSPRPSQSCLLRFGHQILYTNIEGTRRPQSVPTILTETVASTRFLVILTIQWQPKQKGCVEFVSFWAVAKKIKNIYSITFISFPL